MFFGGADGWQRYQASQFEKNLAAKQKQHDDFLKTVATPEVVIKSSQEHQKDKTEYKLAFTVNNADTVLLNDSEVIVKDTFEQLIPLNEPKTQIHILAKNAHKKSEKILTIERNETREERFGTTIEVLKADLIVLDDFSALDVNLLTKLDMLESMAKKVTENENSPDEEVSTLAIELKSKLQTVQSQVLPELRQEYGQNLADKLWEQDIEVQTQSSDNATIEFKGAVFIRNANIEQFYQNYAPVLRRLGFNRANFKWSDLASEYDYFEIDSLDDSVLR